MRPDTTTLADIRRSASYVVRTTAGVGFDAFQADADKVYGVQHQLLIIGEAVKRLSEEFRGGHPGVPWDEIAGMRDVLIHRYDEVDLRVVWDAATRDMPELLRFVDSVLASIPDHE